MQLFVRMHPNIFKYYNSIHHNQTYINLFVQSCSRVLPSFLNKLVIVELITESMDRLILSLSHPLLTNIRHLVLIVRVSLIDSTLAVITVLVLWQIRHNLWFLLTAFKYRIPPVTLGLFVVHSHTYFGFAGLGVACVLGLTIMTVLHVCGLLAGIHLALLDDVVAVISLVYGSVHLVVVEFEVLHLRRVQVLVLVAHGLGY